MFLESQISMSSFCQKKTRRVSGHLRLAGERGLPVQRSERPDSPGGGALPRRHSGPGGEGLKGDAGATGLLRENQGETRGHDVWGWKAEQCKKSK